MLVALFPAVLRDDAESFSLAQVFVMCHDLRFLLFRLYRGLIPFDTLLNFLGICTGLEGVVHNVVVRNVGHVERRHLSLF